MSAADIAGHHRDLIVQFMLACEKSREALAFSWRSVQQMEERNAEDWTQVTLLRVLVGHHKKVLMPGTLLLCKSVS